VLGKNGSSQTEDTMNLLRSLLAVSVLGAGTVVVAHLAAVASAEDTAPASRATVSLHVEGMT
jgi:hypothetical protein